MLPATESGANKSIGSKGTKASVDTVGVNQADVYIVYPGYIMNVRNSARYYCVPWDLFS